MSSYRTKSSSGWSKWTWTPEHSCETRFRTKGSDQEWQFKNEKGEIKSTSVNGTGPVDSNWEDESTGRHQSKSAVIGEDDTVVDSATQMVSNMALQDPPPQGWGDPGSDQRQDTMKTVSYSNRVYAENYAALSSGTGSKPPPGQQQHYPKPRWVNTRSGTISPDQPGTLFDNDKHFRKHDSKKFKFGRVFKIKWSEPNGNDGTQITVPTKNGYVKIRRFVIVKTFAGHSLCLPILTYRGQGTMKRGVHADDHAVIYTDRRAGPKLLKGEELTKAALRMEPDNESHKLDGKSRVNYAKVYTVEHNIPVQFIGALTRNAQAQLSADYNSQHPPIDEIEPEPGYVVQRNSTQSDNFSTKQHYQAAQKTTGNFYPAPIVAPNLSEYTVSASMEADTSREASFMDPEQSPEYTTQHLPIAHPAQFQYAEVNRVLPDESVQTPRIPHSESAFPISSVQCSQ